MIRLPRDTQMTKELVKRSNQTSFLCYGVHTQPQNTSINATNNISFQIQTRDQMNDLRIQLRNYSSRQILRNCIIVLSNASLILNRFVIRMNTRKSAYLQMSWIHV